MDRRHFLKLSAALAVNALTQTACDDDPQGVASDTAQTTDAADAAALTDAPPTDTDDLAGTDNAPDADVSEPVANYPRGEAPTYSASPTAPDDPTAADGAQAVAFNPLAVPEDADLFPLGVQAGAMTPTRALLWTWTDAAASPLRLRVWRDADQPDQPEAVLLVHDLSASPADGGYVHVEVEGLAAGTRYRYAFGVADPEGAGPEDPDALAPWVARSRLGTFRTAFLAGGVGTLRIGASTCTNLRHAPYTSLQRLADADLDLFLHLGDMSYNDAAQDLAGYRAIWRQTLREPNMQALLASAGFLITWDDHEVDNNWDPERFSPQRLAAAKQAFFEALAAPRGPEERLWRSYRWGDTAEVFLLDCRSERRPSTQGTEAAVYIGEAQMAWLKAGLLASPCRFKLILNSVPATLFPGILGQALSDAWGGYQRQRRELVDHITENNVRDVWFLSGDFHFGFVSRLEAVGDARNLWELAVGPGASGQNPVPFGVATRVRGFEEEAQFPADMFRYWSAETKVATILTLDPEAGTLRAEYILGDTGAVLFDEVLVQVSP